MDDIQLSLAAVTLNDLDQKSPIVRRLASLVDRVIKSPKECKSTIRSVVEAASLSLRAYIDRRFEAVIENLKTLEPPKPAWEGFLYQLRGSAMFQLAR